MVVNKFEKFDRSKTHANIGTIGHVGHGQTSLTEAIALVLRKKVCTIQPVCIVHTDQTGNTVQTIQSVQLVQTLKEGEE